jgi:hypothetical protein
MLFLIAARDRVKKAFVHRAMSYRRTTLNTHAATCAVLTSIILREYLITGD